jgi:hypothetical protein
MNAVHSAREPQIGRFFGRLPFSRFEKAAVGKARLHRTYWQEWIRRLQKFNKEA